MDGRQIPVLPGLDEASVRRGRRRRLWLLAAVLPIGVLTGVLLARYGDSPLPGFEPPAWAGAAGLSLIVAGLMMEGVAIAFAVRSGRYRDNRRSPLWAMSGRQRRAVLRQIRRNAPAPDSDPAQLRAVARLMTQQRWYGFVVGGLVLVQLGLAVQNFSVPWLVLAAVAAVLLVTAGWLLLRDAARAATFLADHPETPPAQGSPAQ